MIRAVLKGVIRMKSKLASFVTDHRRAVFVLMLLIAAVSAFLLTKVEINEDLTRYLPDKSAMKQGIDIMAEEFPETQSSQTVRVMFDRLKPEEKEDIRARLLSIPNVTDVAWQADDPDYNRDDHTLFVVSTGAGYKSAEMKAIKKALDHDFAGYETVWHDDDVGNPEVPPWILLCGVAAILLILLVMCGSWIEPFLFLAGIGFAVIINQGTNIVLGSVSTVTASMSAILQLVLSMDYSIILSNRFKQERAQNEDIAASMKTAVTNAFSSVVSSGMTTVAGLLMLVFMSFKIGMDLGIVLAKGVFLSMFCVLVIMPGILIACDSLIRKTTKKSLPIPTKGLAIFSNKAHAAITAVFVFVLAGAFILQQQTGIVYTLQREDPVAEIFPADNMLVLVYHNDDEPEIPGISGLLEEDSMVKSVTCYYTALATPYTAEEMAQNMLDDNESMEKGNASLWKSDGNLENAWVKVTLDRSAPVKRIALRLDGFRRTSYPLQVYADGQLVWEGYTDKCLGDCYIDIAEPVNTDRYEIRMIGPATVKEAFGSMTELAAKKNVSTKPSKSNTLSIIEMEFCEKR